MKRSYFKRKPTVPMKRTRLRVKGVSTVAEIKRDIQATARQIVIIRDKQCILFGLRCYNKVGMEGVVWQAEHLIERSNSATYADTRLIVLICRNCHFWKHIKDSNKEQYDEWVKTSISKERVAHWKKCKQDSWRPTKVDWKLELIGLEQELRHLSPPPTLQS